MWLEWSPLWIAVVNCLGIPAVHLVVSWVATRMPAGAFEARGRKVPEWEGVFYERVLLIRRWKDSLPDAAPWFGGVSKRRLASRDQGYLRSFAVETRRGEWAHWVQLMLLMAFVLWTPGPWWGVIVGYALLSNLPCIFNQRHTRMRLERVTG